VEVPSERKILLSEVESNAYKIASALAKLGLKKGDFTYFVTHELAQLFQVQVSLFLMGGAVRGCHPLEEIGEMKGKIVKQRHYRSSFDFKCNQKLIKLFQFRQIERQNMFALL